MGNADRAGECGGARVGGREVFGEAHARIVHLMHSARQAHCAEDRLANPCGSRYEKRMHTHLRAWRKTKNLSLPAVAERLGVAHTTVGRWERGEVPLTTRDLEDLATIYGITRRQLEFSPTAAEMIAFLDRAQHIIEDMPAVDLERWLAIGESLRLKK